MPNQSTIRTENQHSEEETSLSWEQVFKIKRYILS